jgi:hypothetical protein
VSTLRNHLIALLVLMSATAAVQSSQQDEIDPVRYAQVKAGFVMNFVRYAEWPEEAFEDAESPIIITVLGEDAMTGYLRRSVRETAINDRPVRVQRVDWPRPAPGTIAVSEQQWDIFQERLGESHLLYVAGTEYDRLSAVLEMVEKRPILTVSDIWRFAERGGMVGLYVRDGRVQFDANLGMMRTCDVTISSRVLRLARVVIDDRNEERQTETER